MRITIDAKPRRGLRVIQEIPNIPLCRIEGYNGMGKTSAIKLLQLCVGDQPFVGQEAAWQTFRDQLSDTSIRITDLKGASSVEWEINPSQWPVTPEPLGNSVGRILIDGSSRDIMHVRELLEIHHIRADETISNMLAKYAEKSRDHLRGWLDTHGTPRQVELDNALTYIQDLITAASPAQLPLESHKADAARAEAAAVNRQLVALTEQVELLKKAVAVSEKLDQVRGRGPELDEKLAELDRARGELVEQKARLDEEIKHASERQQRDTEAEKEFSLAQKHFARQETKVVEAETELRIACEGAGIAASKPSIEQARKAAAKRLKDLVALQPQVNATPLLMNLLRDLLSPLHQAEQDGLGEQTLLEELGAQTRITVTTLREAVARQLEAFEQQRPTSSAEELAASIDMARAKLTKLVDLDALLQKVDTARDTKKRASERLSTAAANLPPTTARALNDLLTQRNNIDDRATTLQGQHARLQQARELLGGGQSEDALLAELLRLCASAEVEASRVRRRLQEKAEDLDRLTKKHALAEQAATRATRVASERLTQVHSVIKELSQAENSWIRRVSPGIDGLERATPQVQVQELQNILSAIESARNRLELAISSVQGIAGALNRTVDLLEKQEGTTGTWNDSVRLWLGEEVRRWFDNDNVKQALFESGSSIFLDPLTMIVSWKNGDGLDQRRPLAAFSSGQQALAFTRARMAQLDREPPRASNRLIALDEFGSVIDRDAMAYLAKYLTERSVGKPSEQVVVILPLREGTLDHSRKEAPERVKSLELRGYFAEPLLLEQAQ
ncbi:hypothetical protein [Microbispora bryophytorum]|uniref:hypothetical protein n=1 Tax=Microbispora bryophytorum TaxID=1460882 RepID=UPI00340151CC